MIEQVAPPWSKQAIADDSDAADNCYKVIILEEVGVAIESDTFVVESREHSKGGNADILKCDPVSFFLHKNLHHLNKR